MYQPKPYLASEIPSQHTFQFERMVNGIPFEDNGISISVDSSTGMVIQYNCQWYDNVKFPSTDKAMKADAAFDLFHKESNFGLKYAKTDKNQISLVYGFFDRMDYYLDPVNGHKLGWDGKTYRESTLPVYADINGHWCEKAVNALLGNGYYMEGDHFYPNKKITQVEFLRFLYAPEQRYYADDNEFYKMLENAKVIMASEKAPNKELSRKEASKIVVRFLGLGKSAEHPEIFINAFRDTIEKEYRGYTAICYGLGIMKGDQKGRFLGNNIVTHAEAATVILNVLQTK